MEQGWIKLYRKIEQNDFLMTDNNAFMVFTKLLLFADRNTGSYRTGQRALAEMVNLPYGTTYKALQRLQAHNLIHIENMMKFSKIWITNWTVYQSNKELDSILENNAVQIGKQPKKHVLPEVSKTYKSTSGSAREAQGKQSGSAREDYNKKEELRIKKENNILPAKSPEQEEISKLYYQVIKTYQLPVMNHNTLRTKIKQMTTEVEYAKLTEYLLFLRDVYPSLQLEFKPHINNALDIYNKRLQIENALKQVVKIQAKTSIGRVR